MTDNGSPHLLTHSLSRSPTPAEGWVMMMRWREEGERPREGGGSQSARVMIAMRREEVRLLPSRQLGHTCDEVMVMIVMMTMCDGWCGWVCACLCAPATRVRACSSSGGPQPGEQRNPTPPQRGGTRREGETRRALRASPTDEALLCTRALPIVMCVGVRFLVVSEERTREQGIKEQTTGEHRNNEGGR